MTFNFSNITFPHFRQSDQSDCGPACLKMISKFYGRTLNIAEIREKCKRTKQGVTFQALADAAEDFGFATYTATVTFPVLSAEVPLPCIVQWRQRHLIIVYKVTKKHVYVSDPLFGLIKYSKEEFLKGWINSKLKKEEDEGIVMLIEPTPEFYEGDYKKEDKKKGLNFLLPYFRPYKKLTNQLILGLLAGTILQLVFPFLTQSIVDFGIRNQDIDFVYLILIGQLVIFLSQTSLSVIRSWLLLHLGSRINIKILSDYLRKIMKMPVSFFDSKLPGDLYKRIEDNNRIEGFLSGSSFSTIFSILTFAVFSAVLFYYSITIFAIFFAGSALYILWVLFFMTKRRVLDFIQFDEGAGNSSSLIQLIYGMTEIKLNGSEKRRRWEWEAIRVRLYNISLKSLNLAQLQQTGGTFINELKNIFITFTAAQLVIEGSITLGMLLAIQYIIGQLNVPLANFIPLISQAQDASLSIDRINEVYEQEDEHQADIDKITVVPEGKDIVIQDLSFQYGTKSSEFVLDGLNVTIPYNKVTAIVGSSGSGKTTLLKLLLKFYKPQVGRVSIGDTNLENINTRKWRERIGVVMQEGFIFSDTVARNITESDPESGIDKVRLLDAVRIANLQNFIEDLPAGYNTRIGASGLQLSGGQKQRILIARAVYKNPDIICFDEATSALDANNEKVIMDNLMEFFKNKTVITIAHRLSTVKHADQILVIEDGKIVEKGNHQELTKLKKHYYTLVKNQLELGD